MSIVPDFYVILRDDDQRLHRHLSHEAAEAEATRLVREIPGGHSFYILRAQSVAREAKPLPPVEIVPTDEIPF